MLNMCPSTEGVKLSVHIVVWRGLAWLGVAWRGVVLFGGSRDGASSLPGYLGSLRIDVGAAPLG